MILLCLLACGPLDCLAHGGRTDSNGGHYNRKTGEYHCHREPCFSNHTKTQQAYDEAVATGRNFSKVYDRKDWPHWIDIDHDCQDTRAEILILYSTLSVTFTSASPCQVAGGSWFDPYTGNIYTNPSDLDVDHIVPLAHAHRTGGAGWSLEQKTEFANDVANLLPVNDSANRSKSDKTPDKWRPPRREYWCQYAKAWQFVTNKYQLEVSSSEAQALNEMLATCH